MEKIPKHLKKYLGERSRGLEKKLPFPSHQKQTQHVTINIGDALKNIDTKNTKVAGIKGVKGVKSVKGKGLSKLERLINPLRIGKPNRQQARSQQEQMLNNYPNMAFDRPLNQAPMLQPHQQFFYQPYQFQSPQNIGQHLPFQPPMIQPQQPHPRLDYQVAPPQNADQYQISPRATTSHSAFMGGLRPSDPRVQANVISISDAGNSYPPPPPPYHLDHPDSISGSSSSRSSLFGAGGGGAGGGGGGGASNLFSRPRRHISVVPNLSSTSEAHRVLQQSGYVSSIVSEPFSQSLNPTLTPRSPPIFLNTQGDEYATSQPISDSGNNQPNSLSSSSTSVGVDAFIRNISRSRSTPPRDVVVEDESTSPPPTSLLHSFGPSSYPSLSHPLSLSLPSSFPSLSNPLSLSLPIFSIQSQISSDLPSDFNNNGSSSVLRTSSQPTSSFGNASQEPNEPQVASRQPSPDVFDAFLHDMHTEPQVPSSPITRPTISRQPSLSPSPPPPPPRVSQMTSDNSLIYSAPIQTTLPQMEIAPSQLLTPTKSVLQRNIEDRFLSYPHAPSSPEGSIILADINYQPEESMIQTQVVPSMGSKGGTPLPSTPPRPIIPQQTLSPNASPHGSDQGSEQGSKVDESPEKKIKVTSSSIVPLNEQQKQLDDIIKHFNEIKIALKSNVPISDLDNVIIDVNNLTDKFNNEFPDNSEKENLHKYRLKLIGMIEHQKDLQKDEEYIEKDNDIDNQAKINYMIKLDKNLVKYDKTYFGKNMTVAKYDIALNMFKRKFEKEITAHPQFKDYIKEQQAIKYAYITKQRAIEQEKESGKSGRDVEEEGEADDTRSVTSATSSTSKRAETKNEQKARVKDWSMDDLRGQYPDLFQKYNNETFYDIIKKGVAIQTKRTHLVTQDDKLFMTNVYNKIIINNPENRGIVVKYRKYNSDKILILK